MGLPEHIVLFDGVCNLCNKSVQYIIRHDKDRKVYYAPLQSEIGREILTAHHLSATEFNTFIYVQDGKIYTKSDAALQLSRVLSWPASMGYYLLLIPRFLRDFVYDTIARNRYRWMGKRDTCMLPTPELRSRFLS